MSKHSARIDKPLAIILLLLVGGGMMIFSSAVFGSLGRGVAHASSVAFNHFVFGVGAGTVLLIAATFINYKTWRRFAPHLFILSLIATAMVFVPFIGFEHGGGKRWIVLFGQTFQPSEALKIGTVIMAAAYFSMIRTRIEDMRYGLGGLGAILIGPVILLMLQPDLGTLGIIVISTLAVFVAAGARFRDLAIVICVGITALALVALFMPHARERLVTFVNPSQAPQAEGYQIRQALIAVGSGGLTGRGFGQSVQKFTYLPEPMGDSIFAIAAEEFGFVGAVSIIGLFLAFVLRSLAIASKVTESFGGLLIVGIAAYLTIEAFINIGAMLGVAPLTGVPLTFISQGGSAMLMCLFSAGILLNISKFAK